MRRLFLRFSSAVSCPLVLGIKDGRGGRRGEALRVEYHGQCIQRAQAEREIALLNPRIKTACNKDIAANDQTTVKKVSLGYGCGWQPECGVESCEVVPQVYTLDRQAYRGIAW